MLNDSATATTTLTNEERTAIQEQLERLLSNSHFNQSRRFPSFLRFVIDQTLLGQTDLLKERTLGIEIFGREADYDTASDPIVRVTATEIRKRIAQYYQEPGHETELRVIASLRLLCSSIPLATGGQGKWSAQRWRLRRPPALLPVEPLKEKPCRSARGGGCGGRPPRLRSPVIVVCAAAIYLWHSAQRSPFDFFWGPLVNSSEPVLFCVADQSHYSTITLRDAADPSRQTQLKTI